MSFPPHLRGSGVRRVLRQTCPGRLAYPGTVVRLRQGDVFFPLCGGRGVRRVSRRTCPGRLAYPGTVVRLRQGDDVRRVIGPALDGLPSRERDPTPVERDLVSYFSPRGWKSMTLWRSSFPALRIC